MLSDQRFPSYEFFQVIFIFGEKWVLIQSDEVIPDAFEFSAEIDRENSPDNSTPFGEN